MFQCFRIFYKYPLIQLGSLAKFNLLPFSLAWYFKDPDTENITGAETPVHLTSLIQYPVEIDSHGLEYSTLGVRVRLDDLDQLLLCKSLLAATCSAPITRQYVRSIK